MHRGANPDFFFDGECAALLQGGQPLLWFWFDPHSRFYAKPLVRFGKGFVGVALSVSFGGRSPVSMVFVKIAFLLMELAVLVLHTTTIGALPGPGEPECSGKESGLVQDVWWIPEVRGKAGVDGSDATFLPHHSKLLKVPFHLPDPVLLDQFEVVEEVAGPPLHLLPNLFMNRTVVAQA